MSTQQGHRGGRSTALLAGLAALVVVAVTVVVIQRARAADDVAFELLGRSSTRPGVEGMIGPTATVVSTADELQAAWWEHDVAGEPPVSATDGAEVIFLGAVESSSCPTSVERLTKGGEGGAALTIRLASSQGACTADARPVTFVIATSHPVGDRLLVLDNGRVDPLGGLVNVER